jgi:hypothetical protein
LPLRNVSPPRSPIPPPKPKPAFVPAKLDRLASRLPEPADWATTLATISPLRPDTQSPAKILRELYKPGERVIVFTGEQQSQGSYLFECPLTNQTCMRSFPKFYLNRGNEETRGNETGNEQETNRYFLCKIGNGRKREMETKRLFLPLFVSFVSSWFPHEAGRGRPRSALASWRFGVDRHRRNPMPSPGNGSSKLDWGHRRICSRSYSKDSGMIPHLDVAIDCASSRRSVPPRAEEPAPGSSDRTSGSRN